MSSIIRLFLTGLDTPEGGRSRAEIPTGALAAIESKPIGRSGSFEALWR